MNTFEEKQYSYKELIDLLYKAFYTIPNQPTTFREFLEGHNLSATFFDEHETNLEAKALAEKEGIDIEVAYSILRKRQLIDNELYKRQEREFAERIESQAKTYVDLIEPRKESYAQTCDRLKEAIGTRIESAVFHSAVRMIRFMYSDSQKANTKHHSSIDQIVSEFESDNNQE